MDLVLADASVDAVVTDPPYQVGMGHWDTSVAASPPVWRQVHRVLKPGGTVLSFGSPRTVHRMATAMESAGLEIVDQIAWLYGQGRPQAGRLKPGHEPIVVARRPGSPQLCIEPLDNGRHPANVMLDADAALELDRQSGVLRSGSRKAGEYQLMGYQGNGTGPMREVVGDAGGASRFFWCSRPSRAERGDAAGLTVKPLKLMRRLVRLACPMGGVVLDPFAGSGATLEAAVLEGRSWVGIELEADHIELIHRRLARCGYPGPDVPAS